MKHIHFGIIDNFTSSEIDASSNEFEIIADYLQDVGFLTKKTKKTLIDCFKKSPDIICTSLQNENHMLVIIMSPCEKKKEDKPKTSNGNSKAYRVFGDGMSYFGENSDLSFLDGVKDKDLSFNQAMEIIRKCLPVLYSTEPAYVIREIDNIYKQMKGFEPGFEKIFIYKDTDNFDINHIRIKRVA